MLTTFRVYLTVVCKRSFSGSLGVLTSSEHAASLERQVYARRFPDMNHARTLAPLTRMNVGIHTKAFMPMATLQHLSRSLTVLGVIRGVMIPIRKTAYRKTSETPIDLKRGATMNSIREIQNARQIEGEPHRRWFANNEFDLIIWEGSGEILAFELCYNKPCANSLKWKKGEGVTEASIDWGESNPLKNKTPVLSKEGRIEIGIANEFRQAATLLDKRIAELVYSVICENIPDDKETAL